VSLESAKIIIGYLQVHTGYLSFLKKPWSTLYLTQPADQVAKHARYRKLVWTGIFRKCESILNIT